LLTAEFFISEIAFFFSTCNAGMVGKRRHAQSTFLPGSQQKERGGVAGRQKCSTIKQRIMIWRKQAVTLPSSGMGYLLLVGEEINRR
jgi:hypothetical protein